MDGMDLIRNKRGLMAELAQELGINRSAVAMWKRVPAERVRDVERLTGISRSKLRPDIFGPQLDVEQACKAPAPRTAA